jgi:hypothetical protein
VYQVDIPLFLAKTDSASGDGVFSFSLLLPPHHLCFSGFFMCVFSLGFGSVNLLNSSRFGVQCHPKSRLGWWLLRQDPKAFLWGHLSIRCQLMRREKLATVLLLAARLHRFLLKWCLPGVGHNVSAHDIFHGET